MRATWWMISLAIGCGASDTTSPAPEASDSVATAAPAAAAPAPAPAPAAVPAPPSSMAPETGPRLEDLLAASPEPASHTPWPAIGEALASCPPPRGRSGEAMGEFHEGCVIRRMASWDEGEHRWVILDVSAGEGGIERVAVVSATPEAETELLSTELSADALRRLGTLLGSLGPGRAENLVTGAVVTEFSLDQYAPLVALGGPLAGRRLYLETVADLDAPEHVLWLLDASGARTELGRRPAAYTPCDGDGWWCEATESEDDVCTPQELRAEGRLCVEPWGIDGVAVAEGTMAVVGTVLVAGHGDAPPFHWVVRLPPGIATP